MLDSQPSGRPKSHKIVLAFGSSLGCICLLVLGFGLFLWWRQRHNQQIFFDVNEQHREEVCLGNCTRFHFKELQVATNNFSSKKLFRKGGFGKVYKGYLQDGTVVAVKRLKDGNAIGGEIQFLTEVEMISLSGDFGLANLLDHRDSHVTTAVRGTVVHIAPEYLSTSQSSEKTDVFRLGILLLELISGLRALEFGKTANQKKGAMLDWKSDVTDFHYYYMPVRKTEQEKKLDMIVDKDLKNNYDRIEVEGLVQVALLCTQYLPSYRLKMSEVVWMLEGDGLDEKWEASQRSAEATSSRSRANALSSSERYSDLTDDSSLLVQAMELSGPRQHKEVSKFYFHTVQ
ncbi:hypothetical protein Goarm_006970, partial [Gossypium armourianum]|nr:hypothetical protein [Gossypium armourianum]